VRAWVASEKVRGRSAVALQLYVGLNDGKRRTYQEVAELLHTTRQNIYQLVRPAKNILQSKLAGRVPWASPATFKPLLGVGGLSRDAAMWS